MPGPPTLKTGCCGFPLALSRYAQVFSLVEVQQTFYQPPLPRTLERWRAKAGPMFEFTLKAWQLITHEASSPTYRRLREKLTEKERREAGAFRLNTTVMRAWELTLVCARILNARVILFQAPPRFGPTEANRSNLQAFFREIRRAARSGERAEETTFVWEPRGEWKPDEVKDLCRELNLVHGVDPFKQKPMTSGLGYFRLHGRTGYRYAYSDPDLQELLEVARAYEPCYVLFNNVSMLEDARRFVKLASRKPA